jgi:hypothetical protein
MGENMNGRNNGWMDGRMGENINRRKHAWADRRRYEWKKP